MERREVNVERLIDQIYDAGACPDRWPATLSSIASAANALGAIMFGFSTTEGLVFEYNGALDDNCSTIFKTRHANNAWVRGMAKKPVNQLVVSESILKFKDLKGTEFYDEVLRPQHIGHAALIHLTSGADLHIQFSVQKSLGKGLFSPDEEILLKRLIPHVRRAIGVTLRLQPGASGRPVEPVTERLGCAALTLTRQGELVGVNARAQRLAAAGECFMLSPGGVRFAEPQEQRRLLGAMKRVLEGAPLQIIHLQHRLRRFEVAITALESRDAAMRSLHRGKAAAILMLVSELFPPGAEHLRPPLAQTLTAAEWRVAKVAALGISGLEIARTLDLSSNTVKTHMRRIYQKLNVRRQGELVLVMGRDSLMDDISHLN